jgi:arylsulfatase A-like enzyme
MYKDKPWPHDARVAAAMDTMMDRHVGEITALLKKLGIYQNTLMFFTSDNGAAKRFDGIHNSSGVMQGKKRSLNEGGIRVPMVVRWPGKIKAGRVSSHPWYFPDVMPTFAEIGGVSSEVPEDIDGISILPTLLDKEVQKQHEYMFWQYGVRAVRSGKWKGIGKGGHLYLYDLSKDIEEKNDLSSKHPEIAARMKKYITIGYREPRSQKDDGKYTGKDKK